MSITTDLSALKKTLATLFVEANSKSVSAGLTFSYKSFPEEVDGIKFWVFQTVVHEAGYAERITQEFKYERPANIDAKSMEYHVILTVLSELIQTAMICNYQLGTILNTDTELQKTAIDSIK